MSLLARLQRDSYAIYGRTFEDDHEMTAEEMLEVACRAADAGDVEAVRECIRRAARRLPTPS